MLATNITQAQAFCIASACLQVPVSNPLSHRAQLGSGYLHRYKIHRLNLMRNLLGASSARYKNNQRAEPWASPDHLIAQHRLKYVRRRRDTSDPSKSPFLSVKQRTNTHPTDDKSLQRDSSAKVVPTQQTIQTEKVQMQMTSNSTRALFGRPTPGLERESLLYLSDSSSVYATLNPAEPTLDKRINPKPKPYLNQSGYPKLHQRLLSRKLEALRSLNYKINNFLLHLIPRPMMRKTSPINWSLHHQP